MKLILDSSFKNNIHLYFLSQRFMNRKELHRTFLLMKMTKCSICQSYTVIQLTRVNNTFRDRKYSLQYRKEKHVIYFIHQTFKYRLNMSGGPVSMESNAHQDH